MERHDILSFAKTIPETIEDYPFDDPDFTVLRHQDNRKWFGLIFTLNERLCLNVKANPWEVDVLCEQFVGITHGWHMNKRHWITIDVNSDVSTEDIHVFLRESYNLTQNRTKKEATE